jgi:hypothetical protein
MNNFGKVGEGSNLILMLFADYCQKGGISVQNAKFEMHFHASRWKRLWKRQRRRCKRTQMESK